MSYRQVTGQYCVGFMLIFLPLLQSNMYFLIVRLTLVLIISISIICNYAMFFSFLYNNIYFIVAYLWHTCYFNCLHFLTVGRTRTRTRILLVPSRARYLCTRAALNNIYFKWWWEYSMRKLISHSYNIAFGD